MLTAAYRRWRYDDLMSLRSMTPGGGSTVPPGGVGCIVGVLLALLWVHAPAAVHAWQQIPAAVHVHSTYSTGDSTLEELVQMARDAGLQALLLTENFRVQFEYGLFPLRRILRLKRSVPSLRPGTIGAYMQAVAAVQRQTPDVLLLPGVEIVPHYYWTGAWWDGSLTMHNAQKNFLVTGLPDAKAYAKEIGRSLDSEYYRDTLAPMAEYTRRQPKPHLVGLRVAHKGKPQVSSVKFSEMILVEGS